MLLLEREVWGGEPFAIKMKDMIMPKSNFLTAFTTILNFYNSPITTFSEIKILVEIFLEPAS